VRGLAVDPRQLVAECWLRAGLDIGARLERRHRLRQHGLEDLERQTLIHEMVHFAVFLSGGERVAHGPRFMTELRRLGERGEAWAATTAAEYAQALTSEPLER
jgi:SprT-like family